MPRKPTTEVVFHSPAEKYVDFNFHGAHRLQQAARRIAQDPPAVMVLAGPRGIGRRYFVEAVAPDILT